MPIIRDARGGDNNYSSRRCCGSKAPRGNSGSLRTPIPPRNVLCIRKPAIGLTPPRLFLQKHSQFLLDRPTNQFVCAVAQQLHERVNNFVFLPKPNYRIVTHGGVTPSPLGLLKSTSTIEFQQVTPPSSTHFRTR